MPAIRFAPGRGSEPVKHERIRLDDRGAQLISYTLDRYGGDNRAELERMKRILSRAIRYELTDRQRRCLTMYYLDRMKMQDIARSLCLSPSTVSRHIAAASKKLRRIAAYYER